jgi:hypothetical protein
METTPTVLSFERPLTKTRCGTDIVLGEGYWIKLLDRLHMGDALRSARLHGISVHGFLFQEHGL